MKKAAPPALFVLILSGCGTVQWVRSPDVSEADCTASCNAHYSQCPQVFAGFPERAAVECPAEHNNCLRACKNGHLPARAAATPRAMPPPAPLAAPAAADPAPAAAGSVPVASKEARLRELKHFHDEGLISEDVYRERQKAILAEP
jgi:hypothetical protein